jgi:peptidyl-prolyl cis-trans isomerase SurA
MTDIWKRLGRLVCILAMATALSVFTQQHMALAQSIVVMVNDEPVTSYDIAQRQRFLALSTNLNERMKSRMQSDETKQAFQRYMEENRPQSREEAQALQKKFVDKMQQTVIANAGQSMRKKAIEELIDEKLMLQAAREQKITVSDDEVNQFLTRMAESGSNGRSLEQFLTNFRAQGVDPSTLKDRIRAQSAWRQVIRRVYGSRIRASSPTDIPVHSGSSGTILDVEIVRLKVDGDQKALAEKLIEAENIRQSFKSCDQVGKQVGSVSGATVQTVKQANLKDFRGDAQAVLQKANEGEMTPPVVLGSTIELHAVCSKKTVEPEGGAAQAATSEENETQAQFQLYSERHLKDMRTRAHLKYPKSG